jgi:fermentation-respiration switch protein FrsA (DUF1100 family)
LDDFAAIITHAQDMRQPMTIVLALLGAYVLACVLVFVFQTRLVFFPDRRLVASPKHIGLDYESVFFETEDGVRLHGWFVPAEDAADVLLFFHGNAGNISHRLDSIRIFHDLGLSVFIIDYRGYGASEGRLGESGTYRDARGAFRYLTEERRVAPSNIIYFGRSLGAAVAIELATEHNPKALIAESLFTSIPDVGRRVYPWLPVRLLARVHYDSLARVADISCPKLFIHSHEDELLPIELAERLFAAAADPKTFLRIRGDHNSGFITSGAVYIDGLLGFLGSLE